MFRKLAISAGALTAFAAVMSVGTLAVFTDQESVGVNAFSTSKIDLGVAPATALVAFSGMVPGDSVTNPLTITNNTGSAALRYAISSVATNADSKGLKDALVLTVKTADAGGGCAAFTGTQLYTGDVDSTNGKLLGDAAQGAHTGDRALVVSASEVLCFRVQLPLAASNDVASASSTVTFTFDAEQTANN